MQVKLLSNRKYFDHKNIYATETLKPVLNLYRRRYFEKRFNLQIVKDLDTGY